MAKIGIKNGKITSDLPIEIRINNTGSVTVSSQKLSASLIAGDGKELVNISRKLINYINNGPAEEYLNCYFEIYPQGAIFPTASIWYTDNTKTKKIYEEYYELYSGSATITKPNPIIYKLYAEDGQTVLIKATDTFVYSSVGVLNVSRQISSSYY